MEVTTSTCSKRSMVFVLIMASNGSDSMDSMDNMEPLDIMIPPY